MKKIMTNEGFTTVELLITLFIAVAFLMSGYQLYDMIIKNGGETRAQANVSNKAYDYIQLYKSDPAIIQTICVPKPDVLTNQATEIFSSIIIPNIANPTANIKVECPYPTTPSLSKITVRIKYGNETPQQEVETAIYAYAKS